MLFLLTIAATTLWGFGLGAYTATALAEHSLEDGREPGPPCLVVPRDGRGGG